MMKEKLYFEDLSNERSWSSSGRTISEADIVQFACLTGDFNPLHVDETFAQKSLFGTRVAHGLLGLSYSMGLETAELPWAIVAFMGLEWKFKNPIFIGDTIRYESKIIKMKDLGKRGGVVVIRRVLRNQKNDTVQTGTMTLMIAKKGE